MKLLVILLLSLSIFTPTASFAAPIIPGTDIQAIVPNPTGCPPGQSGDSPCVQAANKGEEPGNGYTLCDLRTGANNMINFGVYLSVFVATLMFAYGGFLYVTGPSGGEEQIKKAHKVLTNAVMGILIVLLAWLIVNLFLSVMTGGGVNFWVNSFKCQANPSSAAYGKADPRVVNPPPAVVKGGGGGGTQTGNSSGKCAPMQNGYCAVQNLVPYFGSNASTMSGVCRVESQGQPQELSGTDHLWYDPQHRSFSVGLFQLNLPKTVMVCEGKILQCPDAFIPPGKGMGKNGHDVNECRKESWGESCASSGFGYTIKNDSLYAECVVAAQKPACNLSIARQKAASGLGPWETTARVCGLIK